MIPLFKPVVRESVVNDVAATLRAGWLSEGAQVREFEREFGAKFGLPHCLALNSGTAGLHLALVAAGVGPGDEVITTAQTFVATAMAVRYVGATPVFADIESNTPNIDAADAARRVTARTKAIIVVHYGGYPCDMEAVNALAAQHRLVVVEDAAHALGAEYKGRPAGALGDFGVFSFQAIKQLTTGDGGMLCTKDPTAHQRAYRARWFGIDRANRKPSEIGQPEWDITEIGFKYHMNDVAAAMGRAQLPYFDAEQERRQALNALYRAELRAVAGLRLLDELPDRKSAAWLFTVRVPRRLEFIRALRSRGVDAAVWHNRIDANGLFGGRRDDLPRQAVFTEEQVSIPMRPTLTDDETQKVLSAVKAGW